MSTELLVTAAHLRILRAQFVERGQQLCIPGCEKWAASKGIDFGAFIAHGVPASVLEQTGDELALQLVSIAREEALSNG